MRNGRAASLVASAIACTVALAGWTRTVERGPRRAAVAPG